MSEGVEVKIEHVLKATQLRLAEQTERSIMLEALCNQQGVEIAELRMALDKAGEEKNGQERQEALSSGS